MQINVGERIRELRVAAGWSQAELAKKISVTRPTVTQWENGSTKNVRDENLVALARVFGISVDELLTGETLLAVREGKPNYGVGAETKEEEVLLTKFRHLNPDDRARIQTIIAALDAEASSDVGRGEA